MVRYHYFHFQCLEYQIQTNVIFQTIFEDGGILDCLQKKIDLVNDIACKQEILLLSEIQGEDVRLDKVLQLSCSEDRRNFCSNLENANSELVYKCLQESINDPKMTNQVFFIIL